MTVPLLHRQIFKELAFLFALCVGSLLTLLLVGRMLQLRELFLTQNLNFLDIIKIFGYLSPFFLLLLIPISCMLAVFLTFLRMYTDMETTALKAGGVSLYRLLPAPALFCAICLAANVWIAFHGVSMGMEGFRATVLDLARTKTQLVLQPGVFNRDFPGLTVYAQQAEGDGVMRTVIVHDRTRKDLEATILAPRGRVRTDADEGEIVFALEDGTIYRKEEGGLGVIGFKQYQVRLDLAHMLSGFDLGEIKPKEMSWARLRALDADTGLADREGGNYARKVRVELHKRLVLPLACLVLGLFAVPMASAFGGLSRHWGLLLALGFFLFYYTLLSMGFALGEAGAVPPSVGLWLPNALFLALGAAGVRQAARERWPDVMSRLSHLRLRRRGAHEA